MGTRHDRGRREPSHACSGSSKQDSGRLAGTRACEPPPRAGCIELGSGPAQCRAWRLEHRRSGLDPPTFACTRLQLSQHHPTPDLSRPFSPQPQLSTVSPLKVLLSRLIVIPSTLDTQSPHNRPPWLASSLSAATSRCWCHPPSPPVLGDLPRHMTVARAPR